MIDQFMTSSFDTNQTGDVSLEAVETYVQAAQRCLERDRPAGLAALNDIFRSGSVPRPALDGRYRGELVAIDLAPGVNRVLAGLLRQLEPWQGKALYATAERGENIFRTSATRPGRLFFPFYGGYKREGELTRAFPFRTWVGPGLRDSDRQVLKLDYDVPANPRLALSIRRILDELVQVADGYYLGKAYVHWYWGSWSLVAYFALRPE